MTRQRDTAEFRVAGRTISALTAGPAAGLAAGDDKPLIAALHGGSYNARYFDVAVSPQPSFMDFAAASGYPVVSFDRPGYGGSTALKPEANTFARHARLLDDAIAQAAGRFGASRVLLIGHSIGSMIATMIAAGEPGFGLIGLSVTGLGAVIRPGGPSGALASLPADETIDLPYDRRDQAMFGPAGTWTPEGVAAAHQSYAPVPVRELIQADRWADDRLPGLAPHVRVPVHNAVAEFDAVFDSSPASVGQFARMLTAAPFVEASIARDTGHSIDHHILGHALHLRQLAFAEECALWARQNSVGR
jgi:pimeloyl-ACP methyl ester carboxylesterase